MVNKGGAKFARSAAIYSFYENLKSTKYLIVCKISFLSVFDEFDNL